MKLYFAFFSSFTDMPPAVLEKIVDFLEVEEIYARLPYINKCCREIAMERIHCVKIIKRKNALTLHSEDDIMNVEDKIWSLITKYDCPPSDSE